MNLKKLVNPHVLTLSSYEPENFSCTVKLDANESPYGQKAFRTVRLNRYPDPEALALRKRAAGHYRVSTDSILHGNGSDELLYYLVTAFGGPVLYPVPTFSMYGIIAQSLGTRAIEIPLDDRFDLDMRKTLRAIHAAKPKLIFLSSPNNPTGNCFSSDRVLKILKRSRCVVVVDEAYSAFSGRKSSLRLLARHQNLVVLKTLSKVGFAGLRVGFMIASPEIVRMVNKVRLPFNLNALSQKVADNAMKNNVRMNKYVHSIVAERKRLFKGLKSLKGIEPYRSDANFILFRVGDPEGMFKALLKQGILVRNISGAVEGCLRVTVGTAKENARFLKALQKIINH